MDDMMFVICFKIAGSSGGGLGRGIDKTRSS